MGMLPDKPIELIPFSDRIHQKIKIKPSDFETLKKCVESFIYDGMSNLTILPHLPISKNDVVLIFSDGMNGLGQITQQVINSPYTFAIVSGLNNNYQSLKKLSGNNLINLNNLNEKEAIKKIFIPELSLISIEVISGKFDQIYPSIGSKGALLIPVCGKMYSESGVIKLNFGIHQKITVSKTIRLNYNSKQDLSLKQDGISTIISRQWAQYQLDELMDGLPKTKPEIIDLSKKYGIVTSYTSLIVLENIVDYVRYHIVPPDEVLQESNRNMIYYKKYWEDKKGNNSSELKKPFVEDIINNDFNQYYAPLLSWWKSPIPKPVQETPKNNQSNGTPNPPSRTIDDTVRIVTPSDGLSTIRGIIQDPSGEPQAYIQVRLELNQAAVNGTNADVKGEYILFGVTPGTYDLIIGGAGLCPFPETIENITIDSNQIITQNAIIDCSNQIEAVTIRSERLLFDMDNSRSVSNTTGSNNDIPLEPESPKSIKINLNKYNPDEAYLKPFTEINSKDELYSLYLQSRKEYLTTPSYFVNVADLFYQKGLQDTAKMILSNILEISNEDYQIVQVYGKKLMEYGFYADAIAAFQYIVELREEFPQSYRDVALAYEANGDYQKAYDQFLFILTKRWTLDDQIKPVIFTEFNSLLNRFGDKIDTKNLNPKLKAEIPVDIRVVLSWDTDNNDIDLHVNEPDKTKCFYGNTLTKNGGKISSDFTRGFGPEQYMMKKGMDGTYEIKAHYFGSRSQAQLMPVTVYADVFLNYCSPDQTHQRMILKLNDKKETFTIGGIEWNYKGKK
jgi:tetratricopeptide (TPR) repeat protein